MTNFGLISVFLNDVSKTALDFFEIGHPDQEDGDGEGNAQADDLSGI